MIQRLMGSQRDGNIMQMADNKHDSEIDGIPMGWYDIANGGCICK